MSDDVDQDERRRTAHKAMIDACAAWMDRWDYTSGSMVTGFVVVMESVRPDGTIDCVWATGNGSDIRDDDRAGLPSWRVDGLVAKVMRDIRSGDVETAE